MKRIGWLIFLGYLAISLLAAAAQCAEPPELSKADALLQCPTLERPQAEEALRLYEGLLSSREVDRPSLLAKLARTSFIRGDLAPRKQAEPFYRKGQLYAQTLIQEEPNRTEGHYWLALNLCGQADAGGYMLGRRLLPRILEELERAVALDEAYDQAGAHRVLGRIYFEAPEWPMSVGDIHKSLNHLEAAVRLAPNNSTNHLFLAQTLYRLRYRSLAMQQLERVLKCTQHAVKPQDLEEDHQEARRLMAEMGSSGSP